MFHISYVLFKEQKDPMFPTCICRNVSLIICIYVTPGNEMQISKTYYKVFDEVWNI